jgi:hypothetical protein
MSTAEAEAMITWGQYWRARVWIGGSNVDRDGLITHVNGQFAALQLPVRLSRGWQPYDPVIRVGGRCHRYADVAVWASGQQDGGRQAARDFRDWYQGNNLGLDNLPVHLLALAVITHLAEVGRGYVHALNVNLKAWIDSIADAANAQEARAGWLSYSTAYPPSLTYAQDVAQEYEE